MASTETSRLLLKVEHERERQVRLWGEQHHPDINSVAQSADFSSMADRYKALNDAWANQPGGTNWASILLEEVYEALGEAGTDSAALAKELTQVAAVCLAWQSDLISRGVAV